MKKPRRDSVGQAKGEGRAKMDSVTLPNNLQFEQGMISGITMKMLLPPRLRIQEIMFWSCYKS
jgi:hypothetical protein